MEKTLTLLLLSAAPLSAQIVDTVASAQVAAQSGSAKCNLYEVDTTRLLFEVEWWLDIPAGPETLTFFMHRHHSRDGNADLIWTLQVPVMGTGTPQWYSSGPIAEAMVAGNHYTIGVAYTPGLTYWFDIQGPGVPISFGNWQRGMTPPVPLNPTINFTGNDGARYYQRITTFNVGNVVNVGTGCSPVGQAPRLVASGFFPINSSQDLELVDAPANSATVHALAVGMALPTPLQLLGCDVWLDVTQMATAATTTSPSGESTLTLSIPNVPALVGQSFTAQSLVFTPAIYMSNGVQFTIS